MKILVYLLVTLVGSLSLANTSVPLDTTASKVTWVGAKKWLDPKTDGAQHNGEVKIASGSVTMKNNVLTGGEFTVDMSSIKNFDVEKAKWRDKLITHLKSEDFFHVKEHPKATFKATKVTPVKGKKNVYSVMGDMTIRGKTNKEAVQVTVTPNGKSYKATGKMTINRLKYGVTYNSDASILKKAVAIPKDKVIKDQIQLGFDLKTKS